MKKIIVTGFLAFNLFAPTGLLWCEDVTPSAASGTANTLEQRLNQLEQQVKSLQQLQAARTTSAPENPLTGESFAGRSGFALRSADGDFELKFHGLIQTDGRFYTGNGADRDAYNPAVLDSEQAPMVSGFLMRRIRPILSGKVFQIYEFLIQPDFGQSAMALYDAYMDVKPWSFANLRIGKFKVPLGVERLQSDSSRTFTERGLTENLIPSRDTGLESERNNRTSDAQRLHMLNSTHVQRKIQQGPKLVAMMRDIKNPRDLVSQIYLTILSRYPTADELQAVKAYAQTSKLKPREAAIDLAWALMNSAEFLYRH